MAFVFFPLTIFPMTWVWMFIYGNLGFEFSYWESLPLGIGSTLLLGLFIALRATGPEAPSSPDPEPAVQLNHSWSDQESRPGPVRL